VGNKAPAWVQVGFAEYAKRMPPDLALELIEIAPPKHRGDVKKFVQIEAEKIQKQLRRGDWVIALDERGRDVSSRELATKLDQWKMLGQRVVFLIGGSDGLAPELLKRANESLSLSNLTFPHYAVRVILGEALYRAWSISSGHPYHRV